MKKIDDNFWTGAPLTTDKDGKTIYYMGGGTYNEDSKTYTYTTPYLFMFDKKGKVISETGVMEITDIDDYSEQLREFKELNNWCFYYQ